MKKICIITAALSIAFVSMTVMAENKGRGKKCFADTDCSFEQTCTDGACVKKKEFDFGSSGKSGEPCDNDADCINSGKCVEGTFGKKVCSGN
ncbi:MAG TPA: hypothetical protein P5115_19675 [Spirochaetota bacterium]|nr:hypothetical protein [Spirochaetota bacterium]